MKIISGVLFKHLEDACFGWRMRALAVSSPDHSVLDLLHRTDVRLDGHLDGVLIASDAGWDALSEELVWKGAGEVFVGTVLACEARDRARLEQVLAVAREDTEVVRGMASGLGWVDLELAQPFAAELVASKHPVERRIGVAAFAIQRQDPRADLARWTEDDNSLVRARALRAVGELGRIDLLGLLRRGICEADEGCSLWSAWSAALLGDDESVRLLRERAEAGGSWAERAADLAARRLSVQHAGTWQEDLARQPRHQRLAIRVAGALGDPAGVPWLMEQMALPPLARVAGEAFSSITGADLAYLDLDGKRPEGFESGPNDDPADENVEIDPDEDLPFPDVERVRSWWMREGRRFSPGTRHLLGRPISVENARKVLIDGKQRQRAAAALELAIARPGSVLFEVRERADRQIARLRE